MTIAKDKVVSVIYELRTDLEGEIIEKAVAETPLTFHCGAGQMLEKFEANLMGLSVGSSFDFKLATEEAYGLASEEAVIDLPKNIFEVNGEFDSEMIQEGNVVPMQDSSGRRMNGIVLEVGETTVKMDFNHPLAGDDLYFKGEVIEVRDATQEEMDALKAEAQGCSPGGCGGGCSC
ncbi:peptidylprolyl isomerase [Ancylomarina salipaludis]|uniref:Peptidyl-prolyl cis-trans isomerase n=1 Tax=Ancylomarina salipaludis TaxID=2501299 RepID=A0A4Q1JMP3_9BACT|nr:FKBP-type peptidyl-prolyl cis-trans isomerase [Ancylomarina salipaludis]RXQ95870.1 peptidylprolyl isomerase [Ancylomarina salipaludis]